MVSPPAAEWVIARFTGPDLAASIVGDLLEEARERGALWFWLSVAGILLRLNWRRLIAFGCGAICFSLLRALPMPVYASLHGMPPEHGPSEIWRPFFVMLGGLAMLLWVATPYMIIRRGFRDRFAQLALAFCVPLTAAVVCWRSPVVVATSILIAVAGVIASTVFARWRGPLLALVVALVVGYAGFQCTIYLENWLLNFAAPSVGLTVWVTDLVPLFAAAVVTAACGWMHSVLTQQNDRDSRIENET
ncbi:MAG: hypothetical protein ACRD4X_14975 [Candidatus Acidiferrales bacterium]